MSHAGALTQCTHTYLCRELRETGKEQEMKPWSLSPCKLTLFPKLLPSKRLNRVAHSSPTPEPSAVPSQSLCRWREATCNVYLFDREAQGRQPVDLEGKQTTKIESCVAIPLHSLHSQCGRTRSLKRNTKGLPQKVGLYLRKDS